MVFLTKVVFLNRVSCYPLHHLVVLCSLVCLMGVIQGKWCFQMTTSVSEQSSVQFGVLTVWLASATCIVVQKEQIHPSVQNTIGAHTVQMNVLGAVVKNVWDLVI